MFPFTILLIVVEKADAGMSRRYSHPGFAQPREIYYVDRSEDPVIGGGSYDGEQREQRVRNGNYGYLESATLQSEISMSIVTDVTRYQNGDRRPSLLRRLTQASLLTRDDDEQKTKMCCGLFNVEPVLLLLSVSLGFLLTSQPLFTYWARCIEIASGLTPNSNVTAMCAQLSTRNDSLQDIVEKDIATMQIWLQVASCVPTLLIAPMIGSWSDKYGRKNPLLFTMVGYLMYTIFQLVATLTYDKVSIYRWYFMAEISLGLCGGIASVFTTCLAVVTDDCRHKLKPGSSTVPMRIGVASFAQAFGKLLGTLFFSLLSVAAVTSIKGHANSYVNAAVIQSALALITFIYAVFFVRETHFPQQDQFAYREFNNVDTDTQIIQPVTGSSKFKQYISGLAEVLCEQRPGWTRLCLCLSLMFVFVEFLAIDSQLLFLLVKRPPFSWSDKMFSYFSLAKNLLMSIGMVLVPLALTCVHWLGKDSIMIIAGIGASAISYFLISQANATSEIFITVGFALLCGAISPGYRSFLPRMVPKEQTARLLTLCSIIVAVCPILSTLLFNTIFNWSLNFWPGFPFFIGGLLQVVVVIGQICVHTLMRPQWLLQQQLKEQRRAQVLEEQNEEYAGDGQRSVSNTSAVGSATPSTSEEDRQNLVV